jgi:hypothetical protein
MGRKFFTNHEPPHVVYGETAAAVEGADVVERLPRIPVTRDEIFRRLDRELRLHEAGLLAAPKPRSGPLDQTDYWIFEAALCDGGRVKRISLIERAVELGCLDLNAETPVQHWQGDLVR